jgi:poly-gamma-glutamate synthesis protein (capsule biosynthesis protein)
VIGAPSDCVKALVNSRIRCLGLANNHILDHGPAGLENTLRVCSDAGLVTFGAGRNSDEAGHIRIVKAGNLRIGLLAIAEQEWSAATDHSPGANPLDPIHNVRTMQRSRGEYDFLIVLFHSGIEYYPYPTPRQREMCRFLIEQGARIVVCQHSHCAGCYETYRNGHIIYGQGNLLFDSPGRDRGWHEGFLVRVLINMNANADFNSTPNSDVQVGIDPQNLSCDWEPIPYVQSEAAQPGVSRMPPERAEPFLKTLADRSAAIRQDPDRIEAAWDDYCTERHNYFMSSMLGHNRLLRRLNRDTGAVARLHSEDNLLLWTNILRCDIHRETALTVLRRHFALKKNGHAK